MEKSKVYFTDFRARLGEGLPTKLKRLMKKAGFASMDMEGKFVAIKIHFGELGNISYLRPNYAKAVVDMVKEAGGIPFLTDCNTLYPGSRKNAIEHMYCAWENGFTPMTVGCPVIIGDGLKGTDDIAVPVKGGTYIKEAKIGRAIMDADIFISLTHFKGHETTGFGGTIKNIGMGCGSRAGKKDQHSNGKPTIDPEVCRGCKRCMRECANQGLEFDETTKKMQVNAENCLGCGRCLGACNFDAIRFVTDAATKELNCRMAEYAKAVVDGRPNFHISLIVDVSPYCDCHGENDAPILPNVGMLASFDPLALDQACADLCLKQQPLPNSVLSDNMKKADFCDRHDHFENTTVDSEYKSCLEHGEEIGLGSREYELIEM
ncbi:NADH-plastoquinone oxidoreductase subunit [uncultured Clostridium sp.]|nr:NADH-plastoquinone oxidoreductase subunit [uncultured Clostridium sp.]